MPLFELRPCLPEQPPATAKRVKPYPTQDPRNRRDYVRVFGLPEGACAYPLVTRTKQICGISVAVHVKLGEAAPLFVTL